MTKAEKAKIIRQVKLERGARRAIEIELGLNKVHGSVHMTDKKDQKRSNKIRIQDIVLDS